MRTYEPIQVQMINFPHAFDFSTFAQKHNSSKDSNAINFIDQMNYWIENHFSYQDSIFSLVPLVYML